MPDSLAELNQVEVVYRGRRVLGPLSLRVGAGAVVGVVGPNGAGKSTLLRLLAGLERPTRGQVRFFGSREPERGTWPWRLAPWRRRIALLLQHHDFCADMPLSVRDVVAFGTLPRIGAFWPRHRAEARAAVEAALHRLGIAALGGRLYRELSGGERQKVQMARVLAQGAELVLLDEPTAGLDLEWKERVTQLVAALRRDFGRTVVMVTHEVDRLPDNCTTVVLMPPGQTPRVGTPDELLTAAALGEVYGCRVQITRQGGRVLACAALAEAEP